MAVNENNSLVKQKNQKNVRLLSFDNSMKYMFAQITEFQNVLVTCYAPWTLSGRALLIDSRF